MCQIRFAPSIRWSLETAFCYGYQEAIKAEKICDQGIIHRGGIFVGFNPLTFISGKGTLSNIC